jgi:hypothetical protein
MPNTTTWSEIDEPVLHWLLARDEDEGWTGRLQLPLRPQPEPRPEIGPALDSRQVDEGLHRLLDHGLIDGERTDAGYARWTRLRLRARGLILLGEWPDLDSVASFNGLQALVAILAEQATNYEDQSALRRTAGAIGRLGEGIVESTITSVATEGAKGL